MDLNQKIIAGILAGFFLIALLRVFSTPLRLVLKLLVNTLLGFAALWVVHLTAGFTGITLGQTCGTPWWWRSWEFPGSCCFFWYSGSCSYIRFPARSPSKAGWPWAVRLSAFSAPVHKTQNQT